MIRLGVREDIPVNIYKLYRINMVLVKRIWLNR